MPITPLKPATVVDLDNCKKLADTEKPFILLLKLGENLFESLLRCAREMNLKSASLSGLGALDNVTVAYYDLAAKEYKTKLFKGMYELISINGNISTVDEKPFVHIHAALGASDYSVIGGHLMDATIGPTAEISIIPFPAPVYRKYDEEIGLKLMCPITGNS